MFKIPRRHASFNHLSISGENHGKEKTPAVTLSVEFTGDGALLDQVLPCPDDEDNTAKEFFFTEKGFLRAPTLNPIKLNRNPEGLLFSIYDRKEPMHFREASAKDFEIEFQEGGTIKVKCKLYGIPEEGHLERLKKVLFKTIELAIESEQDDLFSLPPPKPEKDENENQGDMLGKVLGIKDDASKGTNGKGRNEGLRQPAEAKVKPEPKKAAAKKVPAKKKARASGKRLDS